MRVLWITANFHPEIGGLQTYTERLVEILARQHTVGLVTDRDQCLPGPSAIRHFVCDRLNNPGSTFYWQQTSARLKSIVEEFRPDLIHLANAGMSVYMDVIPHYIPTIASVHGNDLTSPWQGVPGRNVKERIVAGLNCCRRLVTVSTHTAELIRAQNIETEVEIIRNTCCLETFHPMRFDRSKFLESYGIRADGSMLLTVGRLVERKGHLAVAEALAKLDSPFHWIIVGAGKTRGLIRSRISQLGFTNRVSFLEDLPSSDLVRMYNACDVFVLTPVELRHHGRIDSEGFGIVYHEANACGRPVVASDISGCREAVIDGVSGLLVSAGNSEALADALQKLISDSELSAQLGKSGLQYVRSLGGWSAVASEIDAIYEKVLGMHSTLQGVSGEALGA